MSQRFCPFRVNVTGRCSRRGHPLSYRGPRRTGDPRVWPFWATSFGDQKDVHSLEESGAQRGWHGPLFLTLLRIPSWWCNPRNHDHDDFRECMPLATPLAALGVKPMSFDVQRQQSATTMVLILGTGLLTPMSSSDTPRVHNHREMTKSLHLNHAKATPLSRF